MLSDFRQHRCDSAVFLYFNLEEKTLSCFREVIRVGSYFWCENVIFSTSCFLLYFVLLSTDVGLDCRAIVVRWWMISTLDAHSRYFLLPLCNVQLEATFLDALIAFLWLSNFIIVIQIVEKCSGVLLRLQRDLRVNIWCSIFVIACLNDLCKFLNLFVWYEQETELYFV